MKYISIVFIAAFLTGCVTSPVKVSDSQMVSKDRLLSGYPEVAFSAPSKAKVIVVRDSGMLGAGAPAKLLVDGSPIARLWPSKRVEFYIGSGTHILGVTPDPQLTAALSEESYLFTPGKTFYFRISVSETALRLQPSTQLQ